MFARTRPRGTLTCTESRGNERRANITIVMIAQL